MVAGLGLAGPAFAQDFVFTHRIDDPSSAAGSRSVAVDGNTLAIGVPAAPNGAASTGAVFVYVRQGASWTLQQRIAAPLSPGGFGTNVSLSGDTLAVSDAPPDPAADSAVRIFVRTGATWAFEAVLTATVRDSGTSGDAFGRTLRLRGNSLIVGAELYSISGLPTAGAAFVYERTGTTWSGVRLTGATLGIESLFGKAVDISGDLACVGAPGQGQGVAYFFRRSGSTWSVEHTVTGVSPGGNLREGLGWSCAVDDDTAALSRLNGSGGTTVLAHAGGNWTEQQTIGTAFRGSRTLLVGDRLVLGGGTATTVVFGRTGTIWTERQQLTTVPASSFDGTTIVGYGGTPFGAYIFSNAAPPTGPPGAPTSFQATVSLNTVGLSWGPPTTGAAPTGYTVLARFTPAGPVIFSLPLGVVTSFSAPAPNNTYVVSVSASNASGTGPESAPVTITVPAPPRAPARPTLSVTAIGSQVSFVWDTPASGGVPTSHRLQAGFSAGDARFDVPIPGGQSGAGFSGIPPGIYFARVIAENTGGQSPTSNEVQWLVGPPGAPTIDQPLVSGSTVTLSWSAGTGGTPADFTLTAFASVGGPVVARVVLRGTSATFTGVPSGTYHLQLTASNDLATSPPSTIVTVVVP